MLGRGCSGSAFNKPGRKNEAGETLGDALRPPQPVNTRIITGAIANQRYFQFNLTAWQYIV